MLCSPFATIQGVIGVVSNGRQTQQNHDNAPEDDNYGKTSIIDIRHILKVSERYWIQVLKGTEY